MLLLLFPFLQGSEPTRPTSVCCPPNTLIYACVSLCLSSFYNCLYREVREFNTQELCPKAAFYKGESNGQNDREEATRGLSPTVPNWSKSWVSLCCFLKLPPEGAPTQMFLAGGGAGWAWARDPEDG